VLVGGGRVALERRRSFSTAAIVPSHLPGADGTGAPPDAGRNRRTASRCWSTLRSRGASPGGDRRVGELGVGEVEDLAVEAARRRGRQLPPGGAPSCALKSRSYAVTGFAS
jgi:hypothetical protein